MSFQWKWKDFRAVGSRGRLGRAENKLRVSFIMGGQITNNSIEKCMEQTIEKKGNEIATEMAKEA